MLKNGPQKMGRQVDETKKCGERWYCQWFVYTRGGDSKSFERGGGVSRGWHQEAVGWTIRR